MGRPSLLDLFCCEGGAGAGYARAGFDVVGVDLEPQPRYPFRFVLADAMTYPLEGFDALHASPPCQDYSRNLRHMASGYPRLIAAVRARFERAGVPWVIENVAGSGLPVQATLDGAYGVELCGSMFGQRIYRHRLFETSFEVVAPRGCDHTLPPMNPHNAGSRRWWRAVLGPDAALERAWREEMGVGWMTGPGGREAIPPAMTEHIGAALRAAVLRGGHARA